MSNTYTAVGPDQVEAIQWTGENVEEVMAFTDAVQPIITGDICLKVGGQCEYADVEPIEIGTWIVRLPGEDRHHWPYHWLVEERAFPELYQGVPA